MTAPDAAPSERERVHAAIASARKDAVEAGIIPPDPDAVAERDAVTDVIAAHVLYAGWTEDDALVCGCGLTEPEEIQEANDAKVTERWWADHVAALLPPPDPDAVAAEKSPLTADQALDALDAATDAYRDALEREAGR